MKKSIIIILFLLSILMIGAVNASENATNEISTSDVTDDSISQTDDDVDIDKTINDNTNLKSEKTDTPKIKTDNSNNELKDAEITEANNWTELKNAINNRKTSIKLTGTNDVYYADIDGSQISISSGKVVTIDGNGKTIDAKSQNTMFYVTDATLILKNLKIINGKADYGGAIYAKNCNITIINSTLTNNQAIPQTSLQNSYGGAIYAKNNCNITIINSTFTQNTATLGGAIGANENCNITITNSNFTNNKVAIYSGYKDDNRIKSNIIITQSNLNNNDGAIHINSDCNLTIIHSNLNNNRWSMGGAIYISPEWNKDVTIINSTFTQNIAEYGGAIYHGDGKLTIINSNFTKNQAKHEGNAIYLYKGNNANIHKCTFIDNNVVCENGNVDLSDSTIINTDNPTQQDNSTNNDTGNNGNNNNQNPSTANPTTGSSNTVSNTQTNKQTINLIASKKTFKSKIKVKKYTVTLKNKNKPIKKATVKLTVKGKKYTVKTNNKGKATFKITNLKKKGKYTAVIIYKKIKRTVKIIVK